MFFKMKKMLIVNPYKCTGCGLCELACSNAKEGIFKREGARIKIHKNLQTGFSVPTTCLQCENAWCQAACQYHAIERDSETGALIIDEDLCIGCQECVPACPYECIEFDVTKDVVTKCDLCDGTPNCVTYCYPNAIQVIEYENVGQ